MASILSRPQCVNSLRPEQIGQRFTDDDFECIFIYENVLNSNKKYWAVFTKVHYEVSLIQVNGLAQNRRQAVTWTNDGRH